MVSLFGIAVLGKIWELNIKTHEISQENTCLGSKVVFSKVAGLQTTASDHIKIKNNKFFSILFSSNIKSS